MRRPYESSESVFGDRSNWDRTSVEGNREDRMPLWTKVLIEHPTRIDVYLHRSRTQRDDLGIGQRKKLGGRQAILELLEFRRDVLYSKSLHILPARSPFPAFEENTISRGPRAVDPKDLRDQR